MATLLNTGLMNNFAPVFTFLLVYVLVYSVLLKTKVIENQGISAIIAFVLAAMTLFFKPATTMISFMAPWFVVILVLAFFILLTLMIFGVGGKDLTKIGESPAVYWTFIIIAIVIFLFALGEASYVAGEDGEVDSQYESHFKQIAFSPQVLGTLLVLVIAGFAVTFLKGEK